jgi:hypothetical protein
LLLLVGVITALPALAQTMRAIIIGNTSLHIVSQARELHQ